MDTTDEVYRAIPASALDEEEDEDEDFGPTGEDRDDEKSGTRYNVRNLWIGLLGVWR